MSIAFERPYFLILLPILLLSVLWVGKKLRIQNKAKKIKYIVFRCTVITLLVLAVSGVSIDKRQDIVTTIFLVDVSDSMSSHSEEVQSYLNKVISDMPEKNQMGVVAFGGSSEVEQFVTDKRIFTAFGTHPVTTATNVENALSTAMSLFPADTAKRIVLITDGQENEGSMMNMSTSLQAQNVELAVLPMEWEVGEEVYVDNLTVPDTIRVGDQYAITVSVVSNVETDARVSLFSGRTLKGEEEVRLTVGENQFVFYDTADENGFRSYRVEVSADHDSMTVNNEYSAYAQIESQAKVLVVEGQNGEADAFSRVLSAAGVAYDVVTPTGAPSSINQMMEYKTIVLLNVYYEDLKTGFTGNIESYVKDYAGGLIAIGGDNSYALGGYRDTPLEEVLPVSMDLEGERQIPKMEIDMVIDHSGSMSTTASGTSITSLDLAKAAAVKALDSLRKTDAIGVMAFDDLYTWVVEPQAASDKEAITEKINSITIGGGTNIFPSVQAAALKIAESDAQIKHIILLTDGEDYYSDYDSVVDFINEAGITLSTVAVGDGANVRLMSSLAERCNGRYYYTDVNQGLPRIFAKEVFLSAKEYLINEEFAPVIASSHEMISALSEGAPTLKGYIAATAKPTATRVLVSHKDDPILTVWQYGLGKAVAWNSDATGQWTGNWAAWSGYVQFWKNVIDYTITDTGLGEDSLDVVQEGSSALVTYTTKDFSGDTRITGICTDEKGESHELAFDPVSPGTYQAKVATDEVGVYNIALKNQSGDEVVKSINTATAMQYSAEYRFSETIDSLSKLNVLAGGREITMEDEVFLPMVQSVKSMYNIGNILLLLALFIFMLDVVERRLNLELLAPIFAGIRRRAKPETSLLSADKAVTPPQAQPSADKVAEGNMASTKRKDKSHTENKDRAHTEKAGQMETEKIRKQKSERQKEPERQMETEGQTKGKKTETKKEKRARRAKSPKEAPKTLDTTTLLKKQQERNK